MVFGIEPYELCFTSLIFFDRCILRQIRDSA